MINELRLIAYGPNFSRIIFIAPEKESELRQYLINGQPLMFQKAGKTTYINPRHMSLIEIEYVETKFQQEIWTVAVEPETND